MMLAKKWTALLFFKFSVRWKLWARENLKGRWVCYPAQLLGYFPLRVTRV